ncbi:MAG: hypothetical protein O3A00_19610 [Planctomycetota bacterium]|nr:hypothetical protein [Planctomycetota bacterium]
MKGEERHRLQENELKRLLNRSKETFSPFFKQHGNSILLTMSAVVLITAVGWYIFKREMAPEPGWDGLGVSLVTGVGDAGQLETVGEKYPDSVPGMIARVKAAQRHLDQGIRNSFTKRESSNKTLELAHKLFSEVLEANPPPPQIVLEQASFGLAQCIEAEWDGVESKGKDPIAAYETFAKNYPESIYAEVVAERIKRLKSEHSQAFYAWFREQNLSPESAEERRAAIRAASLPPKTSSSSLLPDGHPKIDDHIPSALDKWRFPSIERLVDPQGLGFEAPPFDTVPEGKREIKAIPDLPDSSSKTIPVEKTFPGAAGDGTPKVNPIPDTTPATKTEVTPTPEAKPPAVKSIPATPKTTVPTPKTAEKPVAKKPEAKTVSP